MLRVIDRHAEIRKVSGKARQLGLDRVSNEGTYRLIARLSLIADRLSQRCIELPNTEGRI